MSDNVPRKTADGEETKEIVVTDSEKGNANPLFDAAQESFHRFFETIDRTYKAVNSAIEAAPLPDVPKAAEGLVESAKESAGGLKDGAAKLAANAIETAANTASEAIDAAADKANEIAEFVKRNTKEYAVKEGKKAAFKDGMYQAEYLIAQKSSDYLLALTALSWYAIRCDSSIADDEIAMLEETLDHFRQLPVFPQDTWIVVDSLGENEGLSFEDVCIYLEKVELKTLIDTQGYMDKMIRADGRVTWKRN